MSELPKIEFDRSYHWAGKFEDNEERIKDYWLNASVYERLRAAHYLNATVYGFDPENPPRMDRTAFSMKKRNG
jgi:hypothetical protein